MNNRYRCCECGKRWENDYNEGVQDACPACGKVAWPSSVLASRVRTILTQCFTTTCTFAAGVLLGLNLD